MHHHHCFWVVIANRLQSKWIIMIVNRSAGKPNKKPINAMNTNERTSCKWNKEKALNLFFSFLKIGVPHYCVFVVTHRDTTTKNGINASSTPDYFIFNDNVTMHKHILCQAPRKLNIKCKTAPCSLWTSLFRHYWLGALVSTHFFSICFIFAILCGDAPSFN